MIEMEKGGSIILFPAKGYIRLLISPRRGEYVLNMAPVEAMQLVSQLQRLALPLLDQDQIAELEQERKNYRETKKPSTRPEGEKKEEELGATCPLCERWFSIEQCDVLGADKDLVFCPHCGEEVLVIWEEKRGSKIK